MRAAMVAMLAACAQRPSGEVPARPAASPFLHHYAYFNRARARINEPWFLASRGFEGAQLKYTWSELEPERGRYDFSAIRRDLQILRRSHKRLFIQLQDVSFDPTIVNAPAYLLTDTAFHGGIAGQYARDEDSTSKPQGYAARRWDPAVRARFHALLDTLGREFDGEIEGINLPETSIEFGTSGALHPSGFTPASYRDGIIDNMRALRRAFPRSVAMQYGNFMPGEWLPDDDHGYLRSVYDEARRLRMAMGGPDLRPFRRGQRNHTYAMLRLNQGVAPNGIAVQWGNYEDADPRTGTRITVPALIEFAAESIDVHYVFWETQEPYFTGEVLPFLERRP